MRYRRDASGRARKGVPPRWLRAALKRRTEDCIEWPFAWDSHAYGSVTWNGRRQRAHIVACEYANGPRPPGLEVCHLCNNDRCVNPAHVIWGTRKTNVAHQYEAGTRRPSLTDEQVAEIRGRYLGRGPFGKGVGPSLGELALEYGVSASAISVALRSTRGVPNGTSHE